MALSMFIRRGRYRQLVGVVILVASLFFSSVSLSMAAPGDATVNKAGPTSVKVGDLVTVNLTVSGERCSTTSAADVVLVIDKSNSMGPDASDGGGYLPGTNSTKFDAAVNAANGFINTFRQNTNNQVRVVYFDANTIDGPTNTPISNPPAPGFGTSIRAGIDKATSLLSNSTNSKVIILLTDGLPTRPNQESGISEAKSAAANAKSAGVTIFSIGFGVDKEPQAVQLLQNIASSAAAPYYYSAPLVSSELDTIYRTIAGVATQTSKLGTAGVLTENFDTDNFDFVSASFGGTVTSRGVITFNLPQVNAAATISYVLRAKNPGTFNISKPGSLGYNVCDSSITKTTPTNPLSIRVTPTGNPITGPAPETRLFPATGFRLGGTFLHFWDNNGGLAVFGYPIDSEHLSNGKVIQWLERNRFELHEENAAPYNVLLGRLGVEVLESKGINWQTLPSVDAPPNSSCRYFAETRHSLCDSFLNYWKSNGLSFDGNGDFSYAESLALFGYPISEPRLETNSSGDTVITQWFERARFEFHPNNPPGQQVLLGRLGAELN